MIYLPPGTKEKVESIKRDEYNQNKLTPEQAFIQCFASFLLKKDPFSGKLDEECVSITDIVKLSHGQKFTLEVDFNFFECSPLTNAEQLNVFKWVLKPTPQDEEG